MLVSGVCMTMALYKEAETQFVMFIGSFLLNTGGSPKTIGVVYEINHDFRVERIVSLDVPHVKAFGFLIFLHFSSRYV